ncbi:MAG: FIST C-terminal domain-containing protein [Ruminococcus sp.]|jgi:hypothetical protein|nr:FIST C-terminal domain-containing protein [Ruminococcus sp.]
MIKMLTAHTYELDDIDLAIEEIKSQIDSSKFLKNSVGMVSCHADFITEGITDALCEAFDFPIFGQTCKAAADKNVISSEVLILTVLTSDDAEFNIAVTEPANSDMAENLQVLYKDTGAKTELPIKLVYIGLPLLVNVGGDFFVNTLNAVLDGAPLFGGVAVDHTADYRSSQLFYGKSHFSDRAIIMVISGNLNPKFFTADLGGREVYRDKAVVTEARGNKIITVNGMKATDFLEMIGIKRNEDGGFIGLNMCNLMVDYGDGSKPVVRAVFAETPDGEIITGGEIPQGAMITISYIETDDIEKADRKMAEQIKASGDFDLMLCCSCIGRYFNLAYDAEQEMKFITDEFGDEKDFVFSYVGGEICPVETLDGKLVNRCHNQTFITCLI